MIKRARRLTNPVLAATKPRENYRVDIDRQKASEAEEGTSQRDEPVRGKRFIGQ